jgi:cytochrome P450
MTLALNAGDLWTGGLETVVTTIRWGLLYMIHSPDIQRKIHDELDEKIGQRTLELIDRQQTPYLHATLDELQRIVNVLPWNIPHSVNRDITVCGQKIKSGLTIMPQIGCVHFDKRLFPDPERFDPTRFLDKAGRYSSSTTFMPFGAGKRACLGESLARMELYIVFGSLLQNFKFECDPKSLHNLLILLININ